ncbi:MAG: hybrid sensor histidine kinase/response regulator, partial [Betaproteobacteria bacterium]|nr:hybrid sensor histidine kinase/response regulator [Betaproteobacteria bacterium]
MTKPINMALSLWQSLLGRIRRRPDSEFQQALIRVVIGAGFYAYFGSGLFHHPEAVSGIINLIAVIFLGLSTGLLLATLWQPGASAARRVFGALLDFSTASLLLLIGGETSGPLVLIYFWVTIGNGFRYGVNYLYLSTVLAAIGFMSVLAYNNFWYTHLPLGIGLLLAIIAVPLYAATLMRQLHHAIKRAEQA